MCGIAGIFQRQSIDENVSTQAVQRILESQSFRGPDATCIETVSQANSQIVFGHNRLAIIDLSVNANQPMWDNARRYMITYNGMIYNFAELRAELIAHNYRFHTKSDTEVLLNAFAHWGQDCVNKFNGMFAFAIYDRFENSLYLARDRFGVKPLYYVINQDAVYFASSSYELAKQLQLRCNATYLYHGLHSWCYENNSNQTAYHGLNLVPAASILKITHEGNTFTSQLKQYYQLENNVTNLSQKLANYSLQDLIELTKHTFKQAITRRLIADVPIGVSLSGGVDSALVTGFASQLNQELIAFSYGHPTDRFSEAKRVEQLSKYLNVSVNYIAPNKQEMVDAFWQCLFLQDAPFPNFSISAQYLVFHTAKQHGIKVLLGGQGGDEVFMGYRKFLLFQCQYLLKQKKYLNLFFSVLSMLPNFYAEFSQLSRYLSAISRYSSKIKFESSLQILQNHAERLNLGFQHSLTQRQITDISHTSLPSLLRYEDRNSMGNSIESRLPFLDYQFVELGLSLPTALKLKQGYGKWILRDIGTEILPKNYLFARAKRGFDTNTAVWINAGVGKSMREYFHEHAGLVKQLTNQKIIIDQIYSDKNLINNNFCLHEAIILCWLLGKNQQC